MVIIIILVFTVSELTIHIVYLFIGAYGWDSLIHCHVSFVSNYGNWGFPFPGLVKFWKIYIFKLKFAIVIVMETMSENINQFMQMVSELWADVRSKLFCVIIFYSPGRPGLSYISRFIITKIEKIIITWPILNSIYTPFWSNDFFQG